MDESVLNAISDKLDILIRLVALDVVKGRELSEQIRTLGQAGMKPREIGAILGKTPNAISIALFRFRKSAKATNEQADESTENG